MSDVMRRVVTIFDSQGADRVRASLGQMQSGFSQYRRELGVSQAATGAIDKQLKALGTTLRYGLAGSTVYGTLQMVQNLGQFQSMLGSIATIATGSNGLPLVSSQLDTLGNKLIDVSNRTATPIQDLQDGVLNLYSTIGDVPPNEAAQMMETIAKTAVTAQSNIEDTTSALLGMLNAFGVKGPQNLTKFSNEFYKVIQLSANMTGANYAQKLGVLSSSAALARFTPEQMGALAIGATRFGGSSATNMTYLSQLMTYITNPTTAKEKGAFASIGLNSKALRTLPGQTILDTVLKAINDRGGVGISKSLANASDDTLTQLDQMGATNGQAGISGGGSELLQKLFGRIQSRRMAAILSKLYAPGQVAGTNNQTLAEYNKEIEDSAKHSNEVNDAMGRAMDYKRIQQASNAMHNFGIEVGTALSPFLQWPSRGITAITSDFNNQHWGIPVPGGGKVGGPTAELVGGALGVAGLLKVLRGRGGGAAGLVRGAGGVQMGMAALSGDTTIGHTPLNPLYVAVVYSMGGAGNGLGGLASRIPNRDLRTAESELGVGGAAGMASRASRLSRAARISGGLGGGLLAAYGVDQMVQSYYQTRGLTPTPQDSANTANAQGHPLLKYLGMGKGYNALGQPNWLHNPSSAEQKIIDQYGNGKISATAAESRLRKIATSDQLKAAGITISGSADVTVTIEDPNGNVLARKKVSPDLYGQFTKKKAPQTRGKSTTKRGGN